MDHAIATNAENYATNSNVLIELWYEKLCRAYFMISLILQILVDDKERSMDRAPLKQVCVKI